MKFAALCVWLAFAISELIIFISKRSTKEQSSRDQHSLRLFWIIIPISITAAFMAAQSFPSMKLHGGNILQDVGCAIAVVGLLLRWYSIRYLGRWFTVDVALSPGQKLIQTGPYKLVRHPSYTGALLTLLGGGLLLDNAVSLLLMLVLPFAAFWRRISVEEHVLSGAFGETWSAYQARSWRLIPYVF